MINHRIAYKDEFKLEDITITKSVYDDEVSEYILTANAFGLLGLTEQQLGALRTLLNALKENEEI